LSQIRPAAFFLLGVPSVVAAGFGPAGPLARGATVVYSNDFQAKPGSEFPEWTSSPVTHARRGDPRRSGTLPAPRVTNEESPRGKRRLLGAFGGPLIDPTARTRVMQTVRLSLRDLAPHSSVTVSFDLLVLRSWDGSSPQYGPDRWSLRVGGGPTLLDTTFSNNPKVETDRSFQDYPAPGSRPKSGAAAVNAVVGGFFGDSVYHLSFTFPHASDTLTLEFASDLFEGKGTEDEAWGLDNVRVSVDGPTAGKSRTTSPRNRP
jgi:hypothetical protein